MKEKQKITRQTNITDAMNLNPNTAEILMEVGLGCIGCAFAMVETLEQGLLAHGFSDTEVDKVIEMLNQ